MPQSREEMIADLLAGSLEATERTHQITTMARSLVAMPDQALIEAITEEPELIKHAISILADMIDDQRNTINGIQEMWLTQGDAVDSLCNTIMSNLK